MRRVFLDTVGLMSISDTPTSFLPCPSCGYDLRGATSNRCSECGGEFDPATLLTSGIPWAHRRSIGRVRGFLKTVWMVTIGHRSLAQEAHRPQDVRDGRSFRRVMTALLAFSLVAPFLVAIGAEGIASLAIVQGSEEMLLWANSGLLMDLLVPWSAGATFLPVLPLCLILLAFWITGSPSLIFPRPAADHPHPPRTDAIAPYILSPLVLLLPAALMISGGWLLLLVERDAIVFLGPLFVLLLPWAILATAYHAGRSVHRATGCGFLRGALASLHLLFLWLLGLVLILGLIPWCVGYFWIVIDSFR